ncbi:calvin cycle protein CP12-3, chloroplastic [Typha angustifolia]|uniref:calvin cycle protein CP12-3, chloroplastic n=1 Tax=Typha angustifolia TaxID=59011 RepID=UPI003C2D0AFF
MIASSLSFSSPFRSSRSPSDLHGSRGGDGTASISFHRLRRSGSAMTAAAAAGKKRYKGTAMREETLSEMIEKKVAEAMEACDGEEAKGSEGCRVAWDEVEEVSQAKADLRRRIAESDADPLEPFCNQNPDTDECLVYDD